MNHTASRIITIHTTAPTEGCHPCLGPQQQLLAEGITKRRRHRTRTTLLLRTSARTPGLGPLHMATIRIHRIRRIRTDTITTRSRGTIRPCRSRPILGSPGGDRIRWNNPRRGTLTALSALRLPPATPRVL